MPEVKLIITTADAARILGVHVRTVQRMVADGRLTPLYKAPGLHGALLFDKEAVERVRP